MTVTEDTPPDADIPYARSKRAGEELVREYSQWLPGVIVRIAAVFSDWCEYPPLYALLNNWMSGRLLESRLLAGRGQSAIPYIHVQDLAQFFLRVLDRHQSLARLCTLNAGPDGAVSHLDLYRLATQFYYHRPLRPLLAPRWLLYPLVLARLVQCHLLGREPSSGCGCSATSTSSWSPTAAAPASCSTGSPPRARPSPGGWCS